MNGEGIITAKRIFNNILKTIYQKNDYSIIDGCFIRSNPQIVDPNEKYEINDVKKRVCEFSFI